MISYEISPLKLEYVMQQDVELSVRISNRGSVPIQVPDPIRATNTQPLFSITGPGFPRGYQFSNWSATNPESTGAPPPLAELTIEPGASWTGTIQLSELAPIQAAGEFVVSSTFPFHGTVVRSTDCIFRIEPFERTASISLGLGARPFNKGIGAVLVLQQSDKSRTLYWADFDEVPLGGGEVRLSSLSRHADLPLDATDLATPRRNTPFRDDSLNWIIWREGRHVKALNDFAVTVSFELPIDADLVWPPLKTRRGPAEVLALGADKNALLMVFIPYAGRPTPGLGWQVSLPASPAATTAALGPTDHGSDRHIVFVSRAAQGIDIFHSRYKQGGTPEPFQSVHVDATLPAFGAPLTLLVTADDVAHVGVLARSPQSRGYWLVEAQFGQGAPLSPRLEAIDAPSAEATGAAILYTDRAGAIQRRQVVFALPTGPVKVASSGHLAPLGHEAHSPVIPLQLVSGDAHDWILCTGINGEFHFAPI